MALAFKIEGAKSEMLKPLAGTAYRANRGDAQNLHFIDVPNKEYLDALLGPDWRQDRWDCPARRARRLAAEAARLVAGDQKENIDCPTELPHQRKA